MKKLISVILVLLFVFSFGACTDNSKNNDDKKEKTETSLNDKTKNKDKEIKKIKKTKKSGDDKMQHNSDIDDWKYVKENGELKIGYTIYEPMNYTDNNGNFVGFDTEYAKAVCKKLGIKPVFIEINWDTKEMELDAGNIDCIWNGFTIKEERKENVDFSTPYIKNKQVVVIKKDNAEKYVDTKSLSGAKLVAEFDSVGQYAIEEDENLKKANYTAVAKQTDCLMEVKAGLADVAIIDYSLAYDMVVEGTDYDDLMIIEGLDLGVEQYGIGFRKGSDLTEKINIITKQLAKDGTLEKIADKYEMSHLLVK